MVVITNRQELIYGHAGRHLQAVDIECQLQEFEGITASQQIHLGLGNYIQRS